VNTTRFWTGGATGTAVAYEHFPTTAAGGTTLNCLLVAANGAWLDADCTATSAYVCERVLP